MKKDVIKVVEVIVMLIGIVVIMAIVQNYRENTLNAVVINHNVNIYKKKKDTSKIKETLNLGDNVSILKTVLDKNDNKWYLIEYGHNKGYVLSENVDYYNPTEGEIALMSDVSKFNIQYKTIKSTDDYERFLVQNDINYVYIRAGGRGYGEEGNFYTDTQYQTFIDACEYLGVPYGFYFIDEAINSEEVDEEVEWILDFLQKNGGENCVLPFSIDIEKFNVKARTDEIWDIRGKLVQELIDKLGNVGVETIVYSNAQKANEYLSDVNTNFWLAYYNLEDEIPNYWISDTEHEVAENKRLMNKTIAWQFTESGVKNIIKEKVDINIVKNNFFKQFVK